MGRKKQDRVFDVKREVRFYQSDLDRIERVIDARPDEELTVARVLRLAVRDWLRRAEGEIEAAREAEKERERKALFEQGGGEGLF